MMSKTFSAKDSIPILFDWGPVRIETMLHAKQLKYNFEFKAKNI